VAAVASEAVPDADAGYFGYGGYGYPGYSGLGYARPLLASAYPTHAYSAYHAVAPQVASFAHAAPYAAAPYAAAPYTAAAPVAVAAPAIAAHAAPAAIAAPIAQTAYATPAVAAPIAHAAVAAPVAAPAVTASQYHSQDEFGNYDYSYNNINSAKREYGNALTGVTGSYSYVDGLGATQRVDYVADDFGFRATGTNFPTTAATLGLHRKRRSLIAPYAAPVAAIAPTVSAPAGREAILTRFQSYKTFFFVTDDDAK
jgi:Insect cuticle protein